jgi:hypothetical protein
MKTHPKEGIVQTREVTMWPAKSTRWSTAEGWLRRAIHGAPATNRTWRGHERTRRVLKAHGVQQEYFRGGVRVGRRWRRAPSFSSLSLLSSLLVVMTNVLLGWWGGSRGYRLYSHGGYPGGSNGFCGSHMEFVAPAARIPMESLRSRLGLLRSRGGDRAAKVTPPVVEQRRGAGERCLRACGMGPARQWRG